jgi:hypothetical protein
LIIGKEEYRSKAGEIRQKDVISNLVEVSKIKEGKFRVPELKKLEEKNDDGFLNASGSASNVPF